LRPEALDALRGSDLILHAGDIGKPEILDELRKLAPVVAIRGNVDTSPWAKKLKETELVETAAATFYLIHNINELNLAPSAAGFTLSSSAIPSTRSIRKRRRTLHKSRQRWPAPIQPPHFSRASRLGH